MHSLWRWAWRQEKPTNQRIKGVPVPTRARKPFPINLRPGGLPVCLRGVTPPTGEACPCQPELVAIGERTLHNREPRRRSKDRRRPWTPPPWWWGNHRCVGRKYSTAINSKRGRNKFRSVGRSVGRSIGRSVGPSVTTYFQKRENGYTAPAQPPRLMPGSVSGLVWS